MLAWADIHYPAAVLIPYIYLLRSNQPLWPALTTAQSIAVSPTAKYRLTHFCVSVLSPAILSDLKLGLGIPITGPESALLSVAL